MDPKQTITQLDRESKQLSIAEIDNPEIRNILDKLPDCIKEQYKITPAQLTKLKRQLHSQKYGALSKTAMDCKGPNCPQKDDCVFFEQGIAPMGNPCPYELFFIEMMQDSLMKELEITDNNLIEMSMLGDLIQAELMDIRASHDIALFGFVVDQPVAVDRFGHEIVRKETSVLFEIQEKIKNRKNKIRQQFLATRESKAKYLKLTGSTPDQSAANTMDKFRLVIGSQKELGDGDASESVPATQT